MNLADDEHYNYLVKKVLLIQKNPSAKITVERKETSLAFKKENTADADAETTKGKKGRRRNLRAAKRSKWEKMDDLLSSYGFLSLGDFLDVLFHNHARDEPDPRTPRHIAAVNKFLSGANTFRMSHLIERLYHHRESRPKRRHTAKRAAAVSPHIPHEDIHFAQPSLSAWATRLVGNRIHDSVGTLARKNRDDSESRTHIRASTNGKDPNARVVSWEDTHFTIEGLARKDATDAELVWYLTECMAAPERRNQYASGDLALPLGIWHFACKSHIDVKRVYCRFGSIISDTTVRTSLNTMTDTSIEALQTDVRKATEEDESRRDNQLKVGTACTAVCYEDCKPGRCLPAFVRVLAEFVPELAPLRAQITTRFRTAPIAKHLLPEDRKTINQPIGTNAEHELELKGMRAALSDFDQQLGVEPEKSDNILSWSRGDGASHATIMRLKKYLVTSENICHSFRNVISTPETWHTKATDLNSCASNHFGPAASKDPSSLPPQHDFDMGGSSFGLLEPQLKICRRWMILYYYWQVVAMADTIRRRYASQTAYAQSLSKSEYDKADPVSQVPSGTPWNSRSTADATPESAADNMPGLADIPEDSEPAVDVPPESAVPPTANAKSTESKKGLKIHREAPEFDDDRVLSNAMGSQ
ncbi:hypothetical protein B0H13DRAFT_2300386 [Mycena leptocephala]|nr:hypothetical protein B0H13DRAFT_2300386 [Mycena leptocephala]